MKSLLAALVVFFTFTPSMFCMPDRIIIIRHGEGIYDKKANLEIGPCLSKKGIIRAIAFMRYYIEVLNKNQVIPLPDYIFGANPYNAEGKYCSPSSIRHLQTVAPFVTWMYETHPEKASQYLLDIPYVPTQYKELAKYIVTENHLDGKTILICWTHRFIMKLINDIIMDSGYSLITDEPIKMTDFVLNNQTDSGYTLESSLTLLKWENDDFDKVIFLDFNNKEKSVDMKIMKDCYPVPETNEGQSQLTEWFYSQFPQ